MENGQGGCGGRVRGGGVDGVVEVDVQGRVGGCTHGEGFHAEFFAVELVGVGDVNEGVSHCIVLVISLKTR